MKEINLDECINPALRLKIKKLVELNLDSDSIWDLLDPNLKNYEDDMYSEVEKYVKYVLWLRETGRSIDNAYEKYKSYTQNYDRNFKRDLATRLELEQKRRDQERIDELSALMRYSRSQKKLAETTTAQPEVQSLSPETKPSSASRMIEDSIQSETSEKPTEINESRHETYNEKDDEDTESDLDFIDLAEKSTLETGPTLTPNDLLFETMTQVVTQANDVTLSYPLTSSTLEKTSEENLDPQIANENNKTNEVLGFYEKLEDKYGGKNQKKNLTLSNYELGAMVTYQNEDYIVVKIEKVPDFFNNSEIVVTLKDLKTQNLVHVNQKQLEAKS